MAGILNEVAAGNIQIELRISNESGSSIGTVIDSTSLPGPQTYKFYSQAVVYLDRGGEFAANGFFASTPATPIVNVTRIPPASFPAKRLKFDVYASGDAGNTLSLDYFQVEYAPAVIS
jgi:hypothetical protein